MAALRLALDARTLQQVPLGGVGRELAVVLPRIAERLDVTLLCDDRRGPAPSGYRVERLRAPTARASVWLEAAAPSWLRRSDTDLFHCPTYGLPRWQPVPMVVTIHDLTFEHDPQWFSAARRAAYRSQARWAARTARVVMVPSSTVAAEIEHRYDVPARRIAVLGAAVDPIFTRPLDPDRLAELRRRHALPDRYVVALGGADRRRPEVAVEVWRRARSVHPDLGLLVLGGGVGPQDGVVVARGIADDDWATLLAGSRALVYPTLYEGYGVPALEAMASGVPVVAARVGALPEVLADVGWWAADTSPGAYAEILEALLDGSSDAAGIAAAGRRRAAAIGATEPAVAAHVQAYEAALA